MNTFRFRSGRTPLLISVPHVGTYVPSDIDARMTEAGRRVEDTDWHVDELYDFAAEIGAAMMVASHSRYVVDLNRSPDNQPLYAGQRNTEIVPTTTFGDEPIYQPGKEPADAEVKERLIQYWRPYHAKLAQELAWVREKYGVAVLWDAHSIRSQVPRFFSGRLPDLNFGTLNQTSADPALARRLMTVAQTDKRFTSVLNGRFKGGFITRNFGRPMLQVHAVQLEMSQAVYMVEEPPYTLMRDRVVLVREVLHSLLREALDWARERTTIPF